MCDSHKNLGGTVAAERTSVQTIEGAPEDKIRAAEDHVANMIMTFGVDVVREAVKRKMGEKK